MGALPPCGRLLVCPTQRSLPYHPAPWGTPRGCPPPCGRPLVCPTQRSLPYHPAPWGTPRGCPPPLRPPPRVPNPTLVAISSGPVGAPLVGALPLVCAPSCAQPNARCHIIRPRRGTPRGCPPPLWAPSRVPNPTLVAISSGPVGHPSWVPSPLEAAPSCAHPSWVPSPLVGALSCAQPNARCHIIRPRRGTPRGCPPPCGRPLVCPTQRSLPYHPGP